MAKSKSSTTAAENSVFSDHNGEGRFQDAAPGANGKHASDLGTYGAFIEQAKTWVEENQTTAMISGFGFGVFIGVLLRR